MTTQEKEYYDQLIKYYNKKYFMSNPNNWRELAEAAAKKDFAAYKAKKQPTPESNLDTIVVTPQGNTTQPEWTSEPEKAPKLTESEKQMQSAFTSGVSQKMNNVGNKIGTTAVETASGFTPLWWIAPTVRAGLDIRDGNYKGAAVDAGLGLVAPYAVGKMAPTLYNVGKYTARRKTFYAPLEYTVAHTKPGKRGIEIAMRSTAEADPLTQLNTHMHHPYTRNAAIKYILTGDKKALNTYIKWGGNYNGTVKYGDFMDPGNIDMINAYLYGKPLPFNKSYDAGIHANYIKKHYPNKEVQIYEIPKEMYPEGSVILDNVDIVHGSWNGRARGGFGTNYNNQEQFINVGGFMEQNGFLPSTGEDVFRGQDIWKFHPGQYKNKWFGTKSEPPTIKSILRDFGLNAVNEAGNPIIIRTPWVTEEGANFALYGLRSGGKLNYLKYATCTSAKYGSKS